MSCGLENININRAGMQTCLSAEQEYMGDAIMEKKQKTKNKVINDDPYREIL